MALYKTQAIVVKSINLSESDRLITFLTENSGKIKCVAKGARKVKNQFWGSLEPMSQVNLIYFGKENQNLYRLNQADIIDSSHTIRRLMQQKLVRIVGREMLPGRPGIYGTTKNSKREN